MTIKIEQTTHNCWGQGSNFSLYRVKGAVRELAVLSSVDGCGALVCNYTHRGQVQTKRVYLHWPSTKMGPY